MNKSWFLLLFAFIVLPDYCTSQNLVLDEIVGMVGKNIILKSDIESSKQQYISSGYPVQGNLDCLLFEELLYQKLLLNQAELDSVEIPEAQIQQEMDRRLTYFVNQLGSIERLEKFYGKTITQIKNEFHDVIKEQLLSQNVQGKITSDVKVTPNDVKRFYNSIPKDSLPYINTQVQLAQITKKPAISSQEKMLAKEKIMEYRKRIINGEDFGVLAVLYSEDEGSASKRGELGFMRREMLVPEFSAVAFKLIPKEVSEVVETEFGYHIIQLIEKRGEEANFRHILVKPKSDFTALLKSKEILDSLRNVLLSSDSISFEKFTEKFSDDKETKFNGGLIVNPQTGYSYFDYEVLGQIDPSLFFQIEKMKPGDISEPQLFQEADGSKSYRIVKLIAQKDPHIANLKDDYQMFQEMALVEKQKKLVDEWINKKIPITYVNIIPEYKTCTFGNKWNVN